MIDYTLSLEELPDPLPIEPLTKPFDVTITPPGSKSITCRAYVLAALAEGESKIIRPLRADDTDRLLEALCTLGAEARWAAGEGHNGKDVYIRGVAGRFPRGGTLYMGDGGTPTRFMIACACLAKEPVVIDASPRMRERPIAEGVDMLRQLGANIEYVEEEGRLPVRVVPGVINGGDIEIGTTLSSQPVSALLMIGSQLKDGLRISFSPGVQVTSREYFTLTGFMLAEWGVRVAQETYATALRWRNLQEPNTETETHVIADRIRACNYEVEPDASSAAYWLCAAAVYAGSILRIPGLARGSLQPDGAVQTVLDEWCLAIDKSDGHLIARGLNDSRTAPFIGAEGMPDGAVALAALCGAMQNPTRITGLRTLRVKETDRIAALANELRKVGCTVETGEDWISITPPAFKESAPHAGSDRREDPDGLGRTVTRSGSSSLRSSDPASANSQPIIIETYNDHRMAMAFAVLGLNPPGGRRLAIRNPKCVAKSYPGFWKDFAKLYK